MKKFIFFLLVIPVQFLHAQQLSPLTVEKIMRDPRWIGSSPSGVFWSPDSKKIYFNWNPTQSLTENESFYVGGDSQSSTSDSLYYVEVNNYTPKKVPLDQRDLILAERYGNFNDDKTKLVFVNEQSLCMLDVSSGKVSELIQSTDEISNPGFGLHNTSIIYEQDDNLFVRDIETGKTKQWTDFRSGKQNEGEEEPTSQEQFLRDDALHNSSVLRQRKKDEQRHERAEKELPRGDEPKTIYTGNCRLSDLVLSPDGRFVIYSLTEVPKDVKHTIVPDYVTSSGYTEDIRGRSVVGVQSSGETKSYIYDRQRDTAYQIKTDQIPGIRDLPDYVKDYPHKDSTLIEKPPIRPVHFSKTVFNRSGSHGLVEITSDDHKDRWIMLLDPVDAGLKLLDRQRDEAWVGWAPGIESASLGWVDENTIWYQSEKTGFSHIYLQQVNTGKKQPLTSGNYEVQQAVLSPDKKTFFISTNKNDPGQKQFYQLNIKTGAQSRVTDMKGGNDVTVSPDGKYIAFLFSTPVHPWELYLQKNKPGTEAVKITDKAESPEYQSYAWRKPEILTYKDRDGLDVYASVYRPEKQATSHPGVIFVHGAGYLQDVDYWWSYYFREHMFMNLLADQGYTVMDIDYRGSAGYGRDWRTAIYRHMGGKDLDDILDGAKYMVKTFGVNPRKIGIWGGSYGGFMTLMAMFKSHVFACGGALRSVTDWAHYNHGYTSAILNQPQDDSLAYVRSSPLYFAEGLQGRLLMCHGMVDTNVHFQDIVRLTQKLIELGKKDWQLAVYPVESHDFEEPSSWTDEYSRIYQLFETTLK